MKERKKLICLKKSGALAKNDAGVRFPLVDLAVDDISYSNKPAKVSFCPFLLLDVNFVIDGLV